MVFLNRKGIQMGRNRRKEKAFTLVEVLVVIVLLALIASVYVPRMFKGMGAEEKDGKDQDGYYRKRNYNVSA